MGNPSSPLPRPGDDALSLHTQPGDRLLDDDAPELDDDDLPPLYDEVAASTALLPPTSQAAPLEPYKRDASTGTEYFLDNRLDTDPKFLEDYIHWWARTPPRPYVRVRGSHQQTTHVGGKKEKKWVTDFDVHVEMTPYLYSDATNRLSWRELRTVENDEWARRGTILRARAPGASQIQLGAHKPSLAEWCHRYCAGHAGLKRFTLERRMVGLESDTLRQLLLGLVKSTNYQGHINVSFPVSNAVVEVYNECKTNEWRLTTWIIWLCVFTATFIFTWPYLFFRTKRFEVVVAEWPFSKPGPEGRRQFVSLSEHQWYNMWGRAIKRAVLERRQCTLDQQDLMAAEGAEAALGNVAADTAVAIVRAGVNAMNEVNRQLGWGYDT